MYLNKIKHRLCNTIGTFETLKPTIQALYAHAHSMAFEQSRRNRPNSWKLLPVAAVLYTCTQHNTTCTPRRYAVYENYRDNTEIKATENVERMRRPGRRRLAIPLRTPQPCRARFCRARVRLGATPALWPPTRKSGGVHHHAVLVLPIPAYLLLLRVRLSLCHAALSRPRRAVLRSHEVAVQRAASSSLARVVHPDWRRRHHRRSRQGLDLDVFERQQLSASSSSLWI